MLHYRDYDYLTDKEFLKAIDNLAIKNQYAKITILDWNENELQDIEGVVLSGNISINGDSAMRRTLSLSISASKINTDINDIDNLISINKKVKVAIGIKNVLQTQYSKYAHLPIIWFPQGVYVITDSSLSHGTGDYSISLNLKDKMCLLDGSIAGTFPASTTLDEEDDYTAEGNWVIVKPTIYQIIQEVVHHFGEEQLGKILISDIDDRAKQVMRWMSTTPLYINETNKTYLLKSTDDSDVIYKYNTDIGYMYTDFTYPKELVADAGNSITSVLDSIRDTLGNYEYFYDVHGNFIFQEKKNYINTKQVTSILEELNEGMLPSLNGKAVYNFTDNNIISSYSNSLSYADIKNDFIVWGVRTDSEGTEWPCRYHLAIDTWPEMNGETEYQIVVYIDDSDNLLKLTSPIKYKTYDDFPEKGAVDLIYLATDTKKIYKWGPKTVDSVTTYQYIEQENITLVPFRNDEEDYLVQYYINGIIDSPLGLDTNYYFTELKTELPKEYDFKIHTISGEVIEYSSEYTLKAGEYICARQNETSTRYKTDLDHWLQVLNTDSNLMKISVANIGRRSKVVNDNEVNCVFEPEIPDFILINSGDDSAEMSALRTECDEKGQAYAQIESSIYNNMATGGIYNSAFEEIKTLLYDNTKYNSSITIQCLPIYYLEPNTLITVDDNKTGIHGDYLISNISYSLGIDGQMNITATRINENL